MQNSFSGDATNALQLRDLTGNVYINSQVINGAAAPVPERKLRALAVDDEPHALHQLTAMLHEDPRIQEVRPASDATEAAQHMSEAESALDAVFLDICMPGLDGWQLARLLAQFAAPPAIVFVTAHMSRAADAFDLEVVDYVPKPIDSARLGRAIGRVIRTLQPVPEDVVTVDVGGTIASIRLADVLFVETHDGRVRLHTDSCAFSVDVSLLQLMHGREGFVRINRRHLVAIKHVRRVREQDDRMAVIIGDRTLEVSPRYNSDARSALVRNTWSP
ncbi:LytR/AlgR family response regulator transcription factor [Lentzea sp. E54]|uniref:LytR/AlgR family response regulator transcription factor n=1 Tax=Lentzea xerophila TaxID=3435883 RepID=UPI003DA5742F